MILLLLRTDTEEITSFLTDWLFWLLQVPKKVREEDLRQRAHREAKLIEEATKLLAKIQAGSIKVGAKAGEGDKIFGSVNSIQVADAIKTATGVEVDRKKVGLKEATVKTLGKYTASIRLHKEVEGEFEFEVAILSLF